MAKFPSIFDLTGRTALVTGSTRGIGWSTVQCMAALGATVAINGRKSEAVVARCAEIEAEGGKATTVPFDVTDGAALDDAIDRVVAEAGSLDILVANAAHSLVKPVEETTEAEIVAVFGSKLVSAVAAARKVVSLMAARGWGRIELVSAIGVTASNGLAPLDSAANGALASFAKSLSTRFAPHGVTCNAVAPGFIDTEGAAVYRNDPDNAA
ncbi:MAG: SDR family NAD(P)-dependent oxidoreductase [Rhodospirillaceae bacterium]|nr:SDR family NAD(P)-dependent oxidoreductase [Rhodospirillaceae bacterium]